MSDDTLTAAERDWIAGSTCQTRRKLLRLYDAAMADRAALVEQGAHYKRECARLVADSECANKRGDRIAEERDAALARAEAAEKLNQDSCEQWQAAESRLAAAEALPAAPEPQKPAPADPGFPERFAAGVAALHRPAPAAEMPEGWELDAAHGIAWQPTAHAAKAIAVWNGPTNSLQVACEGDWPDMPLSVLRALLAGQGYDIVKRSL